MAVGTTMVSAATNPLLPLKGAQAQASEPQAHVWLSASAGTGKTHVLTARVFRLLLGGVAPEHILCLTFTKAGASEMAERIHSRLAAWVQMSDEQLFRDLDALGEEAGPEQREAARRLFARVLEATGGGLRIQTIHSFAQQLLSSFPLESGLVPGFRALEDREQQDMAREALEEMVVDAEARGDMVLLDALGALSLRLGEQEAERYLMRCAGASAAFAMVDEDVSGWIFGALDLPQGDVEDEIARRCADGAFDIGSLQRIARANVEWNTASGLKIADAIAAWLGGSVHARAAGLVDLADCFFKKDGGPRAVSKGQIKACEDYEGIAASLCEAIGDLVNLRTRVAYAQMVAQGLHAGRAFSTTYAAAKRRVGAVDYDDLIAHAANLLGSEGIAQWIRYKLDQRTDHVLVDEAQDTNQRQWTIIGALVEEFFAGEGAKGGRARTLFTVGDHKQAIFGFQGTSPKAFSAARSYFRERAHEVEHAFYDLSLDDSFRSTPAVLEVVDAAVDALGVDALGLDPQGVFHRSMQPYPGAVSLLKPVSVTPASDDAEIEGEEDWLADQDRILADRIAQQISGWLTGGEMLASKGRVMRPGDIMILLRKRGDLARLIVARLHEAGVPVAGVDRLRLQAPLGVQDLMAALRFASQPDDDLNLASLLVSPLIGWSQEELLRYAVPRRGSLWRHLRESGAAPEGAMMLLRDLLTRADFGTPYQLLEHVLSGPAQGRRRLLERLGQAALDSIEELLNVALAFEQRDQPSLQGFIDWFDREEGDIKREDDGAADAVRILTVHGAKGLQAPLVILADACTDPERQGRGGALDLPRGEDMKLPLVPPRKEERWGIVDTAMALQEGLDRQEHWRLLYVAMTRAEERLILTGALGPRAKGEVPQESWFALVERAMLGLGAEWREDESWGATMHWHGRDVLTPKSKVKGEAVVQAEGLALPGWAVAPAPIESRPSRPLTPTAPRDDDLPYPPPLPAMRVAAERGRLLHSLFERLPDVPAERRRDAAIRWLEGQGADVALADEALGVMDDPALAALFDGEALAEAPIAAVVGEDVVSGVIDRLLVGKVIRLVDFKTGLRVPGAIDEVPVPYLRQMAAYVAALEVIFPGREIIASLLYTAAPRIFVLPDEMLERYKPGFASMQ
jgi:ATP-dependent helicase/nuclease subunit A